MRGEFGCHWRSLWTASVFNRGLSIAWSDVLTLASQSPRQWHPAYVGIAKGVVDPYFATMEYANGEITEDEYSGRLGAWGVMTLAASRLPFAQVANKALAGFTKTFPKTSGVIATATKGIGNAVAKSPIGRLANAAMVAGEQGLSKIREFFCTKNAGQAKIPPLANVLEGHAAQQGFTGVYDSATGKVLIRPSRTGSDLPAGWVPRRGGHSPVSNSLGGNAANHRGFASILQEDGTLRLTWNSGTLNSPPDYVVPVEMRQSIVNALEEATGRRVSSF